MKLIPLPPLAILIIGMLLPFVIFGALAGVAVAAYELMVEIGKYIIIGFIVYVVVASLLGGKSKKTKK